MSTTKNSGHPLVGCLISKENITYRVMCFCENYAMIRALGCTPFCVYVHDLERDYIRIGKPKGKTLVEIFAEEEKENGANHVAGGDVKHYRALIEARKIADAELAGFDEAIKAVRRRKSSGLKADRG